MTAAFGPPKAIKEKTNPQTEAIAQEQTKALFNNKISDKEANAIIAAGNEKLKSMGMPPGGLSMNRQEYIKSGGVLQDRKGRIRNSETSQGSSNEG